MPTGTTSYGDISPRTAAYVIKDFLAVGLPYVVFEPFLQAKTIPQGNSKSIDFRRYKALDATPNALTEGVTPSSKKLEAEDVTATLVQYGDSVTLTDVVLDTHEDPTLKIATERLGEQAGEMIERTRFGVMKAGTNVFYANGTTRSAVNTPLTRSLQRKVVRGMKRQRAKKITKALNSTPAYGTVSVPAAFIGVVHPDLESDVREMEGFKDVVDYGQVTPYPNEIGEVEGVRYLLTDLSEPWEDAGGVFDGSGTEMLSTSGANADVYPVIYIARDCAGTVALRGYGQKNNNGKMKMVSPVKVMVVNPKPSDSDRLAQRGHAGWKTYAQTVILNDLWMARAEVAATD
jgi:N4-gp56 family major capsid protein